MPDEDFDPSKMSPWVLRIELNRELIADKKLRMDEIAARITEDYQNDIHVIYSDDNAEKLVLRIRIVVDEEDKAAGAEEGFSGQEDDVFLKRLEKNMLGQLKLRGVEDVKKVYIKEVKQTHWSPEAAFSFVDEWILETDGSNLMEVRAARRVCCADARPMMWTHRGEPARLAARRGARGALRLVALTRSPDPASNRPCPLSTPSRRRVAHVARAAEVLSDADVDHTRTISNDIVEICTVLGIEGTRAALLNMLREVISFDGAYVNYRHLSVLCDVMTFRGHLMAITRHGINRADSGPLLRCSFEETVEILMEAAMYGRSDDMNGVTQNIMLGQMAKVRISVTVRTAVADDPGHVPEPEAESVVGGGDSLVTGQGGDDTCHTTAIASTLARSLPYRAHVRLGRHGHHGLAARRGATRERRRVRRARPRARRRPRRRRPRRHEPGRDDAVPGRHARVPKPEHAEPEHGEHPVQRRLLSRDELSRRQSRRLRLQPRRVAASRGRRRPLPRLFAAVAGHEQPALARVLADVPCLLADQSGVFTDQPGIQPHVAGL